MADFTEIKETINEYIYENPDGDITGEVMNEVLNKLVDAVDEALRDIEQPTWDNIKPENGIPESDLSESVQESLDNAESAVIFSGEQEITDAQRNQALANVSNQEADTNTGKIGYKVLIPGELFSSQVTDSHTIYEIRDVFDLNQSPQEVALQIDGNISFGTSPNNYTVYYSNTPITVDATHYVVLKKGQYLLKRVGNELVIAANLVSARLVFYTAGEYYIGSSTNETITYETITPIALPSNCKLKFNGGLIKNGLIVGNNTIIEANCKVFDNVELLGTYANDTIKLSWFCNNGDEAAEIIQSLMYVKVPSIFLDNPIVYISHPISITIPSREQEYCLRKLVYGLDGGMRRATKTTIIPTNDYDADSDIYYRNAAFLFQNNELSIGLYTISTEFENLLIEGNYKIGYGVYFGRCYAGAIKNCNFNSLYISAIKITGTENVTIEECYVESCGSFCLAYPQKVNEDNVLDLSGTEINNGLDENYPVNIIKFIRNYSVYTNYGIVAFVGSDAVIDNCSISYTSCYAIYIPSSERLLNISDCYFEGCGGGNFWIDSTGLNGDVNGSVLCEHLTNSHYGEAGSSAITGWGLTYGNNYRIRSVIHIAAPTPSTSEVNTLQQVNIIGLTFSTNRTRTTVDDVNIYQSLITDVGIDAIMSFNNVAVNIGNCYVGAGSSGYSGLPRYYMCLGVSGNPIFSYAINRKIKIVLSSLPKQYEHINDWYLFNKPSYVDNKCSIIRLDRKPNNYNEVTKVLPSFDDTSIESSDIVKVGLQKIAPYKKTIDGVNYHSLERLVESNGWYGVSLVVNNTAFTPGGSGLSIDDEYIFADLYLHNPTSNNINFYVLQKYRTTVPAAPIGEIDANFYSCGIGTESNPLVIKAGEIRKVSIMLSKLDIVYNSQFAQYLIIDLLVSSNQLLISCLYKYSANNTPSIGINYSQEYDRYGRLSVGDSDSRPILLEKDKGFVYEDTDLNKLIVYKGLRMDDPTFNEKAGTGTGAGGTPKWIANPFTDNTYAYFKVPAQANVTGVKIAFCRENNSEVGAVEIELTQSTTSYRDAYAIALNSTDYPYIMIASDAQGYWGSTFTISKVYQDWVNADGSELVECTIDITGLTNVTIDNDASSVDINKPYFGQLSADSGYTLDPTSVKVYMGGIDITHFAFDGEDVVYIPSVTDNIVIEATATQNP